MFEICNISDDELHADGYNIKCTYTFIHIHILGRKRRRKEKNNYVGL